MVLDTKGQSAIEYLMTYGWMLLVVALVGGLLFTLFQDQEVDQMAIEGFENSDIRVDQISVGSDSLEVGLVSRASERAENLEVCVYNSTDSNCGTLSSLEIGGEEALTVSNFTESNDTYEYDVNLSYQTDSGLNFTEEGSTTLSAVYNESTN